MATLAKGWNLARQMARARIPTARALQVALEDRGVTVSRQTVARLIAKAPLRPSLELVSELCALFACTPTELSGKDEPPRLCVPPPPPFYRGQRG